VSGKVLVVDDDPDLLRIYISILTAAGHDVVSASNGEAAIEQFKLGQAEVIVSDVAMPGGGGVQLLQAIREHDLDVPVILITGDPSLDTAVKAVEHGAFRYLSKPVSFPLLKTLVSNAVALYRTARIKREMLDQTANSSPKVGDRAGLTVRFESALRQLWLAYQPIIRWSTQEVYAYEALVRSHEPTMSDPGALFEAADRLGQIHTIGRTIRRAVSAPMSKTGARLFVNIAPEDLEDEELYASDTALAGLASRTVLEVTERASLDDIPNVRHRIASLRRLGYRIALDDIGAGYSGLNSFALLEPEVVKLDMSLVRDVHLSATKQKLVRSMISLGEGLDTTVIAEGVETLQEMRTLLDLGCDYFQGFLIARPALAFPAINYDETFTSPRIVRAGPS
jgi:EAL domain-containing protein (putative c-di-GMP-specific phosphodiesterase class I)/ActR/RegA family two-component response regulator